jgi:hypothetical protein
VPIAAKIEPTSVLPTLKPVAEAAVPFATAAKRAFKSLLPTLKPVADAGAIVPKLPPVA